MREAFDYCREGDVLVVAKLDRLGRSLRELIDLVGELEGKGLGFRSLKEGLDATTMASGRLIFHVFDQGGRLREPLLRHMCARAFRSGWESLDGSPKEPEDEQCFTDEREQAEGEHEVRHEDSCERIGQVSRTGDDHDDTEEPREVCRPEQQVSNAM